MAVAGPMVGPMSVLLVQDDGRSLCPTWARRPCKLATFIATLRACMPACLLPSTHSTSYQSTHSISLSPFARVRSLTCQLCSASSQNLTRSVTVGLGLGRNRQPKTGVRVTNFAPPHVLEVVISQCILAEDLETWLHFEALISSFALICVWKNVLENSLSY